MIELGIYSLLGFMIIGAFLALELEDLFSSVIILGAVGLSLSFLFLLLQAPDLAVVQLVAELIVLVILVRLTTQKDVFRAKSIQGYTASFVILLLISGLAYFSFIAFKELNAFGSPAARIQGHTEGPVNVLSEFMLNYRSLDTVGEIAIIFTAAVAVLAIIRKTGRIRD